jgi:hypothetical protein
MAFIHRSSASRMRSVPVCKPSASLIASNRSLSFTARRSFSWWWKRGANECSSSLDDSFQRHMLQKQRILRYKYSKALRRRQLRDRDPSHNAPRPTWGWQIHGPSSTDGGQTSSSRSMLEPGLKERATGRGIFDDFAQFKACVDKDPFGAVFGRRLVTHEKPTDSPWSSFSWIFDSTTPTDGQKISQEPAVSNIPPTSQPSGIPSSTMRTPSQLFSGSVDSNEKPSGTTSERPTPTKNNDQHNDEYEFDPISMRKVLRPKNVVEKPAKAPKPLFDPLFAEKDGDIPVKPYKPHRVFGYSAQSSSDKSDTKDPSSVSRTLESKAETSRLAELRKLRAETLGNSIDTTAEYHGKWIPVAERIEEPLNESAAAYTTDEAPLFSGTIYEAKSKHILRGVQAPGQEWLDREGFRTKRDSSTHSPKEPSAPKTQICQGTSPGKLQPSLDRSKPSRQPSDKLEPSLDRFKRSSLKSMTPQVSQNPMVAAYGAQDPTSEDLDSLRASDVRASVRTASQIKEDSEKIKQDHHQKNETAYESHQESDADLPIAIPNVITESSKKLSESLNNLWHRVRDQQKAWLNHKVQSSSSVQDFNLKRPFKQISTEKHEAPVGEVKAASNVRKPGPRPIKTFTPSQEVLDVEKESMERTLELRNASLQLAKVEAELKERQEALARTIKATYEDSYGPITVNHHQVKDLPGIDLPAEGITQTNVRSDKNRVKDRLALCEDAIRQAEWTHKDVDIELKAIRARLNPSNANLPPPAWRMASQLQSIRPSSKEKAADENSADQSATAVKPASSASSDASPAEPPLLYKVLAYDSSTLQMNIAETTSSTSAGGDAEVQPLHPTEVLSRLNNVAKFLPYFAEMEKQGYEIVSGSGDVLVFKKIKTPIYSADATSKSSNTGTEGVPKTTTPSLQEPSPAESVMESIAPNASNSKVRRQEDVFSGSGHTWHQQEGGSGGSSSNSKDAEPGWFRRTVKRVFLAGTLTAAMAYTIGVVAEQAGAQAQEVGPRRSGRPGIYSTEDSR